jgi:hypothetical protein
MGQPGKKADPDHRPSAEEVLEDRLSDPEFVRARERGDEDEAAEDEAEQRKAAGDEEIVKAFRCGVKQFCMARFWAQVEGYLRQHSEVVLARQFGIFPQQVYNARSGTVSADMFCCVLTQLKWNYNDLDPLPSVVDRVLAGLRTAVYLRAEKEKRGDSKIKTHFRDESFVGDLDYLAMCFFLYDDIFQDGRRLDELTSEEWDTIVIRVRNGLKRLQRFDANTIGKVDRDYLLQCHLRWGNHVMAVRDAVPSTWQELTKKVSE